MLYVFGEHGNISYSAVHSLFVLSLLDGSFSA
jgi:hypothetical protein